MSRRLRRCEPWSGALLAQHFSERFFGYPALQRPDLLHVQPEDAGPLREVIDVAAAADQRENIALLHGVALIRRNSELVEVRVFVALERVAVRGAVEREAHLVEGVTLHRLPA